MLFWLVLKTVGLRCSKTLSFSCSTLCSKLSVPGAHRLSCVSFSYVRNDCPHAHLLFRSLFRFCSQNFEPRLLTDCFHPPLLAYAHERVCVMSFVSFLVLSVVLLCSTALHSEPQLLTDGSYPPPLSELWAPVARNLCLPLWLSYSKRFAPIALHVTFILYGVVADCF